MGACDCNSGQVRQDRGRAPGRAPISADVKADRDIQASLVGDFRITEDSSAAHISLREPLFWPVRRKNLTESGVV